jgi:crotonobetainyl-CoA:carnitine CoA-transferase CaiB-like acyl-CoA transferase
MHVILAEIGARVIKVELTPGGNDARLGPVVIAGRSG